MPARYQNAARGSAPYPRERRAPARRVEARADPELNSICLTLVVAAIAALFHPSATLADFDGRARTAESAEGQPCEVDPDELTDCASEDSGSIIECENQVLGEVLAVVGT